MRNLEMKIISKTKFEDNGEWLKLDVRMKSNGVGTIKDGFKGELNVIKVQHDETMGDLIREVREVTINQWDQNF